LFAASLIPGVKATVDEVNRDVTLQFRTLALQLDESLARERLLATLSGFFGALCLWPSSGFTASRRTTLPGGVMKSAFAWRLGRSVPTCFAWSSVMWRFSLGPGARQIWIQ
jgi:hypothetical protein